jgi:hypothetical protein
VKSCTLFFLTAVFSTVMLASDLSVWVVDAAGEIGQVDLTPGPNLGKVKLVGPSGQSLTDIAFSPTGQLYGIGPDSGAPPYNLFSINTVSGGATMIGSMTPAIGSVACAIGTCPPNSLVFSDSGALYTATDELYLINPSTGADTVVGPLGGGFVSGGDLAFVGQTLYLATANNDLVSVNPLTGGATLVGPMGVSNVFGLASPDGATLYGLAGTSVYKINPATGASTFVVNYGGQGLGQAFGEAFYDEAASQAPESSTFLLLGTGLALTAAGRIKRRLEYRN